MSVILFYRIMVLLLLTVLVFLVMNFFPAAQLGKSIKAAVVPKYFILQTRQLKLTQKPSTAVVVNITNKYILNCTNIHRIQLIQRNILGGGLKNVDIGIYKVQKVIIRRISALNQQSESIKYRQLLFLKEILLRKQLDHPGFLQMFGYCVRSLYHEADKDHSRYGIVAVYEHGYEVDVNKRSLSVEDRLKYVLQIAELLVYLQYSPLGSLFFGNFSIRHFLIVDGNIKLNEIDYIHNIEPPCNHNTDCHLNVNCFQSLNETCDPYDGCKTGLCVGYNAKYNLDQVNQNFIKHLLNLTYFKKFQHILHMVDNLQFKLNNHLIDAEQLVDEMQYIMKGRFGKNIKELESV